ncbi:MAG: GPW/gp25 family protein [Candidatus Gastranaerophilales bacterium]|nr:GPW/gp25 family protein [Candidatus Gastranaerophilales bacterium]
MIVKNVKELDTKNWQHKIGTIGEIATELDDIDQCILTIASTQKETVVHNPNLGVDLMQYMDRPINQVQSKMKQMLLTELQYQEPRVKFNNISFSIISESTLKIKIGYKYKQIQYYKEVELIWTT